MQNSNYISNKKQWIRKYLYFSMSYVSLFPHYRLIYRRWCLQYMNSVYSFQNKLYNTIFEIILIILILEIKLISILIRHDVLNL